MTIVVQSSLAQPQNFLELVQRTALECGVPGTINTVANQTNQEYINIINWVREAYTAIQNKHDDWRWLWREFTFNLDAGTRTYDPVNDWDITPLQWVKNSFRLYRTSSGIAGEFWLNFWEYPEFKEAFNRGIIMTNTPHVITQLPNRSLRFNSILEAPYTIRAEYYEEATVLTENEDVPVMPKQYFMSIVWLATMTYAKYEEAGVLYNTTANSQYNAIMSAMERNELPAISLGGPLC